MFRKHLSELLITSAFFWGISLAPKTIAQIVPDSILGVESSVVNSVTTINPNQMVIGGGAVRGSNLFHSFTEFHISESQQVYFTAPPNITDIITRVTGTSSSEIFGTLGVNGDANLLFLNPNGILFGQNSQLDIAGSFLATTAKTYTFENGDNFDTTNPDTPSLLTVNFPVGLQFGSEPGSIINRSQKPTTGTTLPPAHSLPEGLRISEGETLSLLGGEIAHEGGYLNTAGGKIELGAVGPDSLLELTSDGNSWQTSYDEVASYNDIQLQQQAGIDGGNLGGTEIELRGKNISIGYSLEALTDLEVEDFFSLSTLTSLEALPPDPSQIVAQNLDGEPSQVNITASDSFSIIDPSFTQQNILLNALGSGDAGTLNIDADNIILYGAGLESSTFAGATGDSGAIKFQGNIMSLQNSFSSVDTFNSGQGGSINVDLDEDVKIRDGGFSAKAEDVGNGGTIKVDSQSLEIINGGFGANSFGSGNSGKIELDIDNEIIVNSGGFGIDTFAGGDGGEINIETANIEINDGGIGANNSGTGKGGEITIEAETISLRNSAINAKSDSGDNLISPGQGGSIFLEAQNLLFDNGSIATIGGTITVELDNDFQLLNSSADIVAINDINDLENMFNTERTAELQEFLDNNDDKNVIAGQFAPEPKTLTAENEGQISASNNEQGLPGIALVAANSIGFPDTSDSSAIDSGTPDTSNSSAVDSPTPESPPAELFEFGPTTTVSPESETRLISFDQNTYVFRLMNGASLVVNAQELQTIIEEGNLSTSANASDEGTESAENLINKFLAANIGNVGKSDDGRFDLASLCSIENSNFSSTGRGGVRENPLDSITPDFNVADLGDSPHIQQQQDSVPPNTSNKPYSPVDLVVEAKNWKVNRAGNIELMANFEQKNSSTVVNLPNCLKDYFKHR